MDTTSKPSPALPPGWRRSTDLEHGVLLHARAPAAGPGGVVATLRLISANVSSTLADWRDQAMLDLSRSLDYFELDDEDHYVLGDHDVAYRRYAWRRGAHDLVAEEWSWLVGGLGLTLTGVVAREDYADLADVFDLVAASLDPTARWAA